MSEPIKITKPFALYYAGNFVGIIMNSMNYPGGISGITNALSPDNDSATFVELPNGSEDMKEQELNLGDTAAGRWVVVEEILYGFGLDDQEAVDKDDLINDLESIIEDDDYNDDDLTKTVARALRYIKDN